MKGAPSQNLIPISEIRDDVVVLKDNSLRMVMMASSINFALKSPDEQTAIISQYQYFLNSLDFSIQIFAQSTALNIDPYLSSLDEQERAQTNELLRIQTREYREFIKNFVETARIMAKNFYISVPYVPAVGGRDKGGIGGILEGILGGAQKRGTLSEELFAEQKNQLWQRADIVSSGLVRCGVKTIPLKTEELIELFYTLYNPDGGRAPTEAQ